MHRPMHKPVIFLPRGWEKCVVLKTAVSLFGDRVLAEKPRQASISEFPCFCLAGTGVKGV